MMKKVSHWIVLVASIFLWVSCQSEERAAQTEIQKLATQLATSFDPKLAQDLLAQYEAYIQKYPNDPEQTAAYRLQSAELSIKLQRYVPAAQQLMQLLKQKPPQPNIEAALLLAELYDQHLDQPGSAMTAWQAIQEAYPQDAAAKALASKTSSQPAIADRMAAMLQEITVDSLGNLNFKAANEYLHWAEVYAAIARSSAQAPQFLYKAGEVARATRSYDRALGFYQWLVDDYPQDERAPKALFMQAFTYDEDLDKVEEARKCYETFLSRYPKDDFADDAALLLDNLGKTDEQIMKELEQKQQQ